MLAAPALSRDAPTLVAVGIDVSLTRTALASFGAAQHFTVIKTKPASAATARLRHIADAVYYALRDWPEPVGLVVMETPGFVQRRGSMEAVYRAQGAVLTGIPSALEVEIVEVYRWRKDLGIRAGKGLGKQPTIDFVRAAGVRLPTHVGGRVDDDVADAFGLSIWGARQLAARAASEA